MAGTEQATSASSFINSIGVNTHFAYCFDATQSYQTANFSQINTLLTNLGVEHIRDGLVCSYANDPTNAQGYGAYDQEFTTLASAGIHADLISDPRSDNNTQTPAMAVSAITAMNAHSAGVEAVEGPNELDTDANYSYAGNVGFPNNVIAYQQGLYAAFKGASQTANLTVIGPSEGETYGSAGSNPLAASSLYNSADVGNFHPYSFGGDFESQHYTYDTINWYYGQADTPSVNIDGQWPYSFPVYQPPFAQYNNAGTMTASLPMYATEKGYFNGTAAESVDAVTLAKYIPRMFADDMVAGITRTYSYELLDQPIYTTTNGVTTAAPDLTNGFNNGGLIAVNANGTLSPKPAYYTLQHMIQLLKETGSSSSTSALNYTLSYDYPPGYGCSSPNYWGVPTTIQHLLLQKSDGTFELLLWNDVSSAAIADTSGNALACTARDIAVPTFPVTLQFDTPVNASAVFYGLDPTGTTYATTLDTSQVNIAGDQITLNVPDYVTILEFTAAPEPAPIAYLALGVVGLILRRPLRRSGCGQ